MIDRATEAGLIAALRDAARAEVLPRFRALSPDDIQTKSGPADLVTVADRAAEEMLERSVSVILPGAAIVGEEAVSDDPGVLDHLAQSGLQVIVDPIDGTANYTQGNATFGMILAVVENGQTVLGVLFDPICDDWVVSRRGAGAWFVRHGSERRLTMRPAPSVERAEGFLPLYLFPARDRPSLAALFPRVGRAQSLRCSCHEYRMLVTGHADFMVSHVSKPWDHAAGLLAVDEAGGSGGRLDGTAHVLRDTDARLIAAGDARLRGSVAQLVGEAIRG